MMVCIQYNIDMEDTTTAYVKYPGKQYEDDKGIISP
jgi:hypothetical protein